MTMSWLRIITALVIFMAGSSGPDGFRPLPSVELVFVVIVVI